MSLSAKSIFLTALVATLTLTTPLLQAGAGSGTKTKETTPAPKGAPAPSTTEEANVSIDPAIEAVRSHIDTLGIDKSQSQWRTRVTKFPELTFTDGATYRWHLKTNKGDITMKFLPETAPQHVANFVYLTELGFFDELSFHRVITDFMAQGGCPLGTGTGSPAYRFNGEYDPSVKHTKKGLLSMANAGPGTDGSQFFLTFKATPWLDGKHTIFGELEKGEDTLDALEAAGSGSGRTSEPLSIEKATISVE